MIYEAITANPAIAYTIIGIGCVIALYGFIKAMQSIGLEKIRKTVYKAFVHAENRFKKSENDKKFEYVVEVAKKAIPAPFSFFITEELLRDVIQLWFDLCKDLLDDGRINGTVKENSLEKEVQ